MFAPGRRADPLALSTVTGRIVIDDVTPRTPTGAYPAKATVGEKVPVGATVFKDGHDSIAGRVRVTGPAADRRREGSAPP